MKLSEQLKNICETEVMAKSHYLIFGFKGYDDLEHHHVTLMYFGTIDEAKVKEIESIVDQYFVDHPTDTAFDASFTEEDFFGPEKDVRVLKPTEWGYFLTDLRKQLEPFNGSQFKEYRPHYTTDLPAPQERFVNRLMLSKDGYEVLKTWELN